MYLGSDIQNVGMQVGYFMCVEDLMVSHLKDGVTTLSGLALEPAGAQQGVCNRPPWSVLGRQDTWGVVLMFALLPTQLLLLYVFLLCDPCEYLLERSEP